MSATVTWTCDRCGESETEPLATNDRPQWLRSVNVTVADSAGPRADDTRETRDLCIPCRESVAAGVARLIGAPHDAALGRRAMEAAE